MKASWKSLICTIALVTVLFSQVTASAGIFSSVVKGAAGVALKSGGSGASMMKKAAGMAMGSGGSGAASMLKKAAQGVVPGGGSSLTGKILGKAKDIAISSPNSFAGKVLNKAKTAALDPNSLTSKVLSKAKTAAANPNSITSKIIGKVNAAGADPNSLTNKVLNRAKTSLSDPNSLTSKIISKANTAVNDPNSLTSKIMNKATTALNDPNSLTSKVINRAKQTVDDPNSLTNKIIAKAGTAVNDPNSLTSKIINRTNQAIDNPESLTNKIVNKAKGVLENDPAVAQNLIEAEPKGPADDLLLPFFEVDLNNPNQPPLFDVNNPNGNKPPLVDVNNPNGNQPAQNNANQQGQNNTDQLVGQILSAGIQAGGQILSSAMANGQGQGVMIPMSQMSGGYAPASYVEQPAPVSYVEQPAQEVVEEAVPVAADLELADLRFVDNGSDEQGPRYRVTVKNIGRIDVASEITVALLASVEADGESVSTLGSLQSLKTGETKTVDLRLPSGSQVLEFLTAAVALTDGVDANETDNVANFDRDSVRETALQMATVRVDNGRLVLVGEGFGRDAGKLTFKVGSSQVAAQVGSWSATEVGFQLPRFDARSAKFGNLQIIRADGRTAQPLAIRFAQ